MITLHVHTDAGELTINLDSIFEQHKMDVSVITAFEVKVDNRQLLAMSLTP